MFFFIFLSGLRVFIYLSFPLFLLFFPFNFAFADSVTKPTYKAQTVDECIQEKECVWYVFSKQLGMDDYTHWIIMGSRLNKWDNDISIAATGNAFEILPQFGKVLF